MAYIITSKTRSTKSYQSSRILKDKYGFNYGVGTSEEAEKNRFEYEQACLAREKERNEREHSFRNGGFFGDTDSYVSAEVHNN